MVGGRFAPFGSAVAELLLLLLLLVLVVMVLVVMEALSLSTENKTDIPHSRVRRHAFMLRSIIVGQKILTPDEQSDGCEDKNFNKSTSAHLSL